jgi:WD40 repeat protein
MLNTKGHVASITAGQFHPKTKEVFITSSLDGSVRQWDINSELYGVD